MTPPPSKTPLPKPRRDRALLLKRHPYSESSIIATVLTREHGLVQVLARGAHRPKSRFYAVLDAFHELELEWTPSKRSLLGTLNRGDWRIRRRHITEDLEAYRVATTLMELTHLGSRPGHREREMFDLLSAQFDRLNTCPGPAELLKIRIEFQLGFLQMHGLAPALETCASCAKGAPAVGTPPRVGFSAGSGGRLCAACVAEVRAAAGRVGTLPLDVVEVAAKMMRSQETCAGEELLLRVRDFVERFLDYHLGTRPRSHREFLSEENRNAPHRLVEPRT